MQNQSIYITKEGEGDIVILSMEQYEKLCAEYMDEEI